MFSRINCCNLWWILMGIVWIISVIECREIENEALAVDIIPGVKLLLEDEEINVKLNIQELLPNNAIGSRVNHDTSSKKPNIMQRIGSMLMMIPIAWQLLSLPGALASIKMSLLKSIFVGKLALIIMLYNLFRSFQMNRELTVVHQQQPSQNYHHYYVSSTYHDSEDNDDDKGWFG